MSYPLLLVSAVLAVGLVAAPADAAPRRPCGTFTLWATNAAAADSWDFNGDRVSCHPRANSDDPYVSGRDNSPILPRGTAFTGYKFYSFTAGEDTRVTGINTRRNRLTAWVLGQEDDADMNGCRGLCLERLAYDSNDLFYGDFGHGSRRMSVGEFESTVHRGMDRFSIVYDPGPRHRNLFSFDFTA